MANDLSITYCASRDMLGVVSDEEYERFKELVLEALQDEWPDAQISVEDEEEASIEVDGLSGQAEQDVRDRLEDIVNEILDAGDWEEEDEDLLGEDEETAPDEDEEF